jgi:hypothetical protein
VVDEYDDPPIPIKYSRSQKENIIKKFMKTHRSQDSSTTFKTELEAVAHQILKYNDGELGVFAFWNDLTRMGYNKEQAKKMLQECEFLEFTENTVRIKQGLDGGE